MQSGYLCTFFNLKIPLLLSLSGRFKLPFIKVPRIFGGGCISLTKYATMKSPPALPDKWI